MRFSEKGTGVPLIVSIKVSPVVAVSPGLTSNQKSHVARVEVPTGKVNVPAPLFGVKSVGLSETANGVLLYCERNDKAKPLSVAVVHAPDVLPLPVIGVMVLSNVTVAKAECIRRHRLMVVINVFFIFISIFGPRGRRFMTRRPSRNSFLHATVWFVCYRFI